MTGRTRAEAEALFFQGNRHMQSGEDDRAEECFRNATEAVPDFAEAYANLAFVQARRGNPQAAKGNYRRSIELNGTIPESHLNLGALLAGEKQFADAEAAYRAAIELRPRSPAGWSNLGALYACIQREEEAERCLREAMSLDERYANARFNLGYLLLRQGRFEEGWHALEARDWYTGLAARLRLPRWQGEALRGKSILIGCEAGIGDMIHFCRYADVLKAWGASSVGIICPPPLKRLFATLKGLDTIIAFDDQGSLSGWDLWTPLFSIPYRCKTRLEGIPAKIPYLWAEPTLVVKYAPLLPRKGVRVGLVWKGNPSFENDSDRSLPSLEVLAPWGRIPGIRFVSLQKGNGEDEARRPPTGFSLLDVGPLLNDFADTAAVVANLDLVICVDTAIAHLAGALGKPCWVMLPAFKPDWRWLTDRADSPWYPGTMRLFRQSAVGDWDGVISEVATALYGLAQQAPGA